MAFAPKVLNDENLQALGISAEDVVQAIEGALRAKAAGDLHTTPKSVIQPGDGRYMMTTLGTGGDPDVTVVKAVTVCPDNPARGLPSITGAIMVLDAQSGECLTLMDAEWITAVRTAGLSAVAARRLADPDSAVIGFVGCGVQARSHLEMFAGLYPLKEVVMMGRGQANLDQLAGLASDLGLSARAETDPDALLASCDIVVSSLPITFAGTPFLDASKMRDGAFASITDAAKPWTAEGRDAFGSIIVDDLEQESAMQPPMVPIARIQDDLTGILAPEFTTKPGPRAFMFRGIAVGDHALAARVWSAIRD